MSAEPMPERYRLPVMSDRARRHHHRVIRALLAGRRRDWARSFPWIRSSAAGTTGERDDASAQATQR